MKFRDLNGEGKMANFYSPVRMVDKHGLKHSLPADALDVWRFWADDSNDLPYRHFGNLLVDLVELGYSVECEVY